MDAAVWSNSAAVNDLSITVIAETISTLEHAS